MPGRLAAPRASMIGLTEAFIRTACMPPRYGSGERRSTSRVAGRAAATRWVGRAL
jgi:hypothetical protein